MAERILALDQRKVEITYSILYFTSIVVGIEQGRRHRLLPTVSSRHGAMEVDDEAVVFAQHVTR